MSTTKTVFQSRPLDAKFDPVYTTSNNENAFSNSFKETRTLSSNDAISGPMRFKYFKRPIMPRISAIPPQVLLAPTTTGNPLLSLEEEPEVAYKSISIQTVYRDSETQTLPYTPDYVTKEGENPEVLLLKEIHYGVNLPADLNAIEIIEQARVKQHLENNMLPFTDEACATVRKYMMEAQELREYHLRENELEIQRDSRLAGLKHALQKSNESAEFLASQRVEGIRQTRMYIREQVIQKIRKKRIKVLRKLVKERNILNPIICNTSNKDIVNDFFDHSSQIYAPATRDGKCQHSTKGKNITTGKVFLNLTANIESVEDSIPKRVLEFVGANKLLSGSFNDIALSRTAPLLGVGGGRLMITRHSSVALRAIRNNKRDVETMNDILKRNRSREQSNQCRSTNVDTIKEDISDSINLTAALSSPLKNTVNRKLKGRPRTPNLFSADKNEREIHCVHVAVVMLQKLLRGRAVQNSMFEGRYKRAELIAELRAADEYSHHHNTNIVQQQRRSSYKVEQHYDDVKDSTLDNVIGAISSNIFSLVAEEKVRNEVILDLQRFANIAIRQRYRLEMMEMGRRQKGEVTVKSFALSEDPINKMSSGAKQFDVELNLSNGIGEIPLVAATNVNIIDELFRSKHHKVSTAMEVISNIENYPSFIEMFRRAKNYEERIKLCSDLVQALSPDSNTDDESETFQSMMNNQEVYDNHCESYNRDTLIQALFEKLSHHNVEQ